MIIKALNSKDGLAALGPSSSSHHIEETDAGLDRPDLYPSIPRNKMYNNKRSKNFDKRPNRRQKILRSRKNVAK